MICYRWVIEEFDNDGDPVDHLTFLDFESAIREYHWLLDDECEYQTELKIYLVRTTKHTERRCYANMIDKTLPRRFTDERGKLTSLVPLKHLQDFERFVQ